ncbi:MAG: DUF2304 domain-containing protein, partial [Saprospiraceae bacterium]|nr:DUF2304 domain-containing protein [Saprospiraceae bacterium]
MAFYQWLVPLIAVVFVYRIIKQYNSRKRIFGSLVIWILFWIIITALAIIPDSISFKIAELLGFKSNINAVIFVALGFLFIFMFYMNATVEKLEKQMTDMVRKLAM